MGHVSFLTRCWLFTQQMYRQRYTYCIENNYHWSRSDMPLLVALLLFSRGSENSCNYECRNVQTPYSTTPASAQSLQAELAMTLSTLCKHCHPQSAFGLPVCNDRADSSNGLYLIVTSLHEGGSESFHLRVVSGKDCQIESLPRRSLFRLSTQSQAFHDF